MLSLCPVPEVRDLDCELYEVTDWIPLGLRLGIKLPEMKIIEKNYPNDLKRHRIEMFEEWQKKVTPTWSAVVQALDEIGMRRLASELAQKHGWLRINEYLLPALILVEQLFFQNCWLYICNIFQLRDSPSQAARQCPFGSV